MSDDRMIVAQALAHKAGGFEALVDRHHRLVWHVLLRMVSNREDARDLTQEVFLRVHQRLGQFRFESSLATWIGRIAYSIAVRHLERKRIPLADDDSSVEAADSAGGPEQIAFRAGLSESVTNALDSLSPLQRTIVSLYYFEEMTTSEIAAIIDTPAGTVKSHLFRARKQLRQELQQQEWNPDESD